MCVQISKTVKQLLTAVFKNSNTVKQVFFKNHCFSETLVNILNMFLLNDVLERSDTIKKIMKLNLSDSMLYKREDTTDIGLSANMEVQNYKRLSNF